MSATATDNVRRLTRPDLKALGTPKALAELERRKGRRQEQGKAYHERVDAAIDRALADVVRMFETGDLPAAIATTVIRRAEGDLPMNDWSLTNQLIALLSGTSDARGPKQWEKAGRRVRKDARPITILAPRISKFTVRNDETGEDETRRALRGFTGLHVYALEDTDGDPVPPPADYTPATMPPLFDVAARLGVRVRWTHFTRDYLGYFQPGRNEIVLCTADERTFFHELAHAAHEQVLKAKDGRGLKGGQVVSQEVVAETCAATLCRLYGLDGYIYHGAEYVRAYAGKSGGSVTRALTKVLADVQATLNLILEGSDDGD